MGKIIFLRLMPVWVSMAIVAEALPLNLPYDETFLGENKESYVTS